VHEPLARVRLEGDLIGTEPGDRGDRGAYPRILLEEWRERAEPAAGEQRLERLRLLPRRVADGPAAAKSR
jgi:hypothetical protein